MTNTVVNNIGVASNIPTIPFNEIVSVEILSEKKVRTTFSRHNVTTSTEVIVGFSNSVSQTTGDNYVVTNLSQNLVYTPPPGNFEYEYVLNGIILELDKYLIVKIRNSYGMEAENSDTTGTLTPAELSSLFQIPPQPTLSFTSTLFEVTKGTSNNPPETEMTYRIYKKDTDTDTYTEIHLYTNSNASTDDNISYAGISSYGTMTHSDFLVGTWYVSVTNPYNMSKSSVETSISPPSVTIGVSMHITKPRHVEVTLDNVLSLRIIDAQMQDGTLITTIPSTQITTSSFVLEFEYAAYESGGDKLFEANVADSIDVEANIQHTYDLDIGTFENIINPSIVLLSAVAGVNTFTWTNDTPLTRVFGYTWYFDDGSSQQSVGTSSSVSIDSTLPGTLICHVTLVSTLGFLYDHITDLVLTITTPSGLSLIRVSEGYLEFYIDNPSFLNIDYVLTIDGSRTDEFSSTERNTIIIRDSSINVKTNEIWGISAVYALLPTMYDYYTILVPNALNLSKIEPSATGSGDEYDITFSINNPSYVTITYRLETSVDGNLYDNSFLNSTQTFSDHTHPNISFEVTIPDIYRTWVLRATYNDISGTIPITSSLTLVALVINNATIGLNSIQYVQQITDIDYTGTYTDQTYNDQMQVTSFSLVGHTILSYKLPVNYSEEISSPENERDLLFIPDNSGGDYDFAYLGIPIELTIEITDNLGYTASFSTNVTIPDVFGSIQLINFNHYYSPTNHELEFDFDFVNTSSNRFTIYRFETSLKHYKFGNVREPRGEASRLLSVMVNSSKDFANVRTLTSFGNIQANTTSSFTDEVVTIKPSFSSLQDIFDLVDVNPSSSSEYRMDLTTKVTLYNSFILRYGQYYKRINHEIDVTRTLFGYMVYPCKAEQGAQPSFTPTFYANTADFILPTPFTFPHFGTNSVWNYLNTNDHHFVYDDPGKRRVPPLGQSEPWWDDLTIGFTAGNYPTFSATITLWKNFKYNAVGSGSEISEEESEGNDQVSGFSLSYPNYQYSTPLPSFNIHLNTTDYNSLEHMIQSFSRTFDDYYDNPVWEEFYFKVEVVQTTSTGLTKTHTFDTSTNFDFWPTTWIDSYFTFQSS